MLKTPIYAWSILALALLWIGASPSLERAITAQKEFVAGSPDDPDAHNDLANLLSLAGRLGEADAAYSRALELDPSAYSIRFNRALLWQQLGRVDAAEAEYEAVLARDVGHAWTFYQLGTIYESRGQRQRAIEHYARAFALDTYLTFPRNNPHLIDNQYVTEALLKAQEYTPTAGSAVPRQFAEPERIQRLILEIEADPGDMGSPAAAPAASETEGSSDGASTPADAPRTRPDSEHSTPAPASPPDHGMGMDEDDEEWEDDGEASAPPAGAVRSRQSGGRVPTGGGARPRPETRGDTGASSPSTSTNTTVVPVPVPSRSVRDRPAPRDSAPQRRAPRTRPRRSAQDDAAAGSDRQTEAEDNRSRRGRFRPGRRSTGSLELKLVPTDPRPTERFARLAGSASGS